MNLTTDDWNKAKQRFDAIRQQYQALDGLPGVNVTFALRVALEPLARRYNAGERTQELYDAMISVQ